MKNNYFIEEHFPPIYDEKGNLIPGNPYYSFLDAYDSIKENESFTPKVFAAISNVQRPYGTSVPEGINITLPRKKQRTIAQGRDFYVVGTLNLEERIPSNAELTVSLRNENNKVVREVKCYVKDDQDNLYLDPSENKRLSKFFVDPPTNPDEVKALYDEVRLSCIPDLVCSTDKHFSGINTSITRLDGLRCSWNKAYYTDTFFSALIYGGEYNEDNLNIREICTYEDENLKKVYKRYNESYTSSWINNRDKRNKKISVLPEGDYKLTVILKEDAPSGKILAQQEIDIVIGDLPQKIMTTFSYPNHMKNMVQIDLNPNNQQTLLIDPFPGMWIRSLLGDKNIKLRLDEKEPIYFGYTTNEKRGVFNNGAEYRGGNIVFYDYGVMLNSNVYVTEMAQLFKQLNNKASISYSNVNYLYGEPDLCLHSDGKTLVREANSPSYNDAKKLFIDFTRYEIQTYFTDEIVNGVHNPKASRKLCFNKDSSTIIKLQDRKKKFALVGVCSLMPEKVPSLTDPYGRYIDVDRVTEIVYDLIGSKGSKYSISLPVKLTRYLDDKGNPTSQNEYYNSEESALHKYSPKEGCFEFKHVFDFSSIPGFWAEKEITINCRGVICLSSEKEYMPPEGQVYCECCKIILDN